MTPAAVVAAVPALLRLANVAAPDSAAVALEEVARALDGWHEFYLLAGTGAVTLVGLLFVALSFHLDAILDDSRSHLLAAARMAFMNFLYVLLMSLFFLMPGMPPRMHGFTVLVLSGLSLGYLVWNGLRTPRPAKLTKHEQFLRRRFMISGFILGIGIVAAINFMLEPRRLPLIQFAALTCAMLANSTGMAWDLLVQVGRIRKLTGEAPRA